MTPFLWTMTALLIGSLVVLFALTLTNRSRAAAVRRLGRSVGLAVPIGHEERLAARAARKSRASVLGAFTGTALIVFGFASGLLPAADPDSNVSELWLLIGGYFVGLAVGAMVNALTFRPAPVEGERYARSGAVDLRDYLAPIDRYSARIAVAVSVALLTAAALLHSTGSLQSNPLVSASAIVVGLGVVSLVLFEVAARRILERAQPVASPAELAWDDAIRSQNVREIATAPISLGLWGALAVMFTLLDQPIPITPEGNLLFGLLMGGIGLLVLVGIIATTFSIANTPQRHYLRRLWPEVAADLARPASVR